MSTHGAVTIADLDSHVAAKGLRPILCPECLQAFSSPEALGPHLERHSPVLPPLFTKTGRPKSRPCPKGCGRHFPNIYRNNTGRPTHTYRYHITLCDGQAPLPPAGAGRLKKEA